MKKICKYCGAVFETEKVDKLYCSFKCRNNYAAKLRKMRGGKKFRRLTKCKYCGEEFEARQPNQVFCSLKCSQRYHQKNRAPRPPRPPLKCQYCGKYFSPKAHSKKYCSKSCAREAQMRKPRTEGRECSPNMEIFFTALAKFVTDHGGTI